MCSQTAICFLQRNTKFYSCIQTVIRFITVKHKIYSCTQTAIRFLIGKYGILQFYPNCHSFLTAKYKILKTVPKRPSPFSNEIQSFENCTQTAIPSTATCSLNTKYEIFKVAPKWSFVF